VLTDPDFIQRLETLHLLARKVLGGTLRADRKSEKKGSGILFADHAEYALGDDYRSIDWHIFGRLEQLMIRLYELEEDVNIHVLLDLSRSMRTKTDYSRKLAAALGYIALANSDRLGIYGLADTLVPVLEPSHGKGRIFTMLRSLQAAECFGTDTRFGDCARAFRLRTRRKGVCVVISDFFARDYSEALRLLRWSKHEVFCIQVSDPADGRCDWRGDVELECVESGRRRRVTIGPAEARRFEQAIEQWNRDLRRQCARQEIGFAAADIDVPFEDVIQKILRRGGLVA
jgi:uncharacterized protein (DUF58 family)